MRIAFFGTPDVAVLSLQQLVEAGHDLPLVVTQPDRPTGRSRAPVPSPVKRYALDNGLPVEQPVKVRTRTFRERVAACDPEVLVVVAFGRILSMRLIEQTPFGAVNLHFSLLPRYRGGAPVQWALANAERATGVTTMSINANLDEGDVLMQREVEIHAGEHAPSLFRRLASIGAPVLSETLDGLAAGRLTAQPQRPEDATFAPILTREDGQVDPSELEARLVEGRVRGFDPWPGVWLRRGEKRLRLVRAEAVAETSGLPESTPWDRPGTLAATGSGDVVMVCAARTALRLIEVQPDGRSVIGASDALNGRQILLGERLEPVRPD